MPNAIGIDLGISFSCVGIFQNGKVTMIRNDYGNLTTPSYVAITKKERIVGDRAKNQDPRRTFFNIHRFMTTKMYDSFFQSYIDQWSFRPIAVEDATLSVLAEYKNEVRVYSAEKLLSFILKYLKKCAEDFIGDFVKDAVISVPTCFNHLQRQSIKEAAALAGLNVLRIISSTNAAALAYNFNNQKDENKKETNVLVFDLGGGALGVSILTVGDTCAVESVAGNPHLGGEDFDNLLVDHCVVEFKRQYKKDIVSNPRAFRQLRNACEEAKCRLSSSTETNIKIDSLLDGIDFCRKISRQSFEELCADLFGNIIDPIERALCDAKMDKNEIDEIVLVGGSTRIPKIQQLLSDFFPGKPFNKSLHLDEVVAYGAAIKAAILSGDKSEILKPLLLLGVAPFSLGIKTFDGIFNRIIKRDTRIPFKSSKTFTTFSENQSNMIIRIYEGESAVAKENQMLAQFKFYGIPPAPKGVPQIEIILDIDVNNFLTVSVQDKLTGIKQIVNNLNDESHWLFKREVNNKEEEEEEEKISVKQQLLNFCYSIKLCLEDVKVKNIICDKDYNEVGEKCKEILFWIDKEECSNEKEFENRQKQLQSIWNPIIIQLYKSVGYTEERQCKQIK